MKWCTNSKRESKRLHAKQYASPEEIDNEFKLHNERLLWLAEVITGDRSLAEKCVIDARELACKNSSVFRDWLAQWARAATIKRSIECVRDQIVDAEMKYSQVRCEHGGHEPPAQDHIESIQGVPARDLISALDPFARAVLVLRGIQRSAVQECALTLRASRASVTAAFCLADPARFCRLSETDFSTAVG